MRKTLTLLPLLTAVFFIGGCDRLSDKDRMDMIAKCDSEARKKIKERSEQGRHRGGDWYEDTTVSTHYSFSEKRCFALEETFLLADRGGSTRTLYDGLTKKELIRTSHMEKNARVEELYISSNSIELTFTQKTEFGRYVQSGNEIDRLMNLP